jgi:DNA repair photolyase
MSPRPPPPRGRGAASNASGRYESLTREAFDDGWAPEDAAPPPLRTTLTAEAARAIISRNDSPDIPFDQSINPYRGCENAASIATPAPPTPIWASRPVSSSRAASSSSRAPPTPRILHLGGNTDPYQPVERQARITRGIIEVLGRFRHPFSVITKGALIRRDHDLLGPLGQARLARAAVSITTLDRGLARIMEPRAATPGRRLEAVRRLADAGVPTQVMFAPVIHGLNDHELEAVLEAAAEAGAATAGYVALRLPLEIKDLFEAWLAEKVPDRAARVMSLVRQMRGGKANDPRFGQRMRGEGPIADLLARRMVIARKRLGLDRPRPALDLTQFKVPPKSGDQTDLFG